MPGRARSEWAWTVGSLAPLLGLAGAGMLLAGRRLRGTVTLAAGFALLGALAWSLSRGAVNALGAPTPLEVTAFWVGLLGYSALALWSLWDLGRTLRTFPVGP